MLSYFSRWALVSIGPVALILTTWTSLRAGLGDMRQRAASDAAEAVDANRDRHEMRLSVNHCRRWAFAYKSMPRRKEKSLFRMLAKTFGFALTSHPGFGPVCAAGRRFAGPGLRAGWWRV
jgi:hypothetical protein